MNRYIKIILSAVLGILVFLSPFIVIAATVFGAPTMYDDTFLGELTDKHTRLKTTDGDRIILIGGSSMAFGLDSAMLEKYTGRTVVNYGLYATIGTKAMLDLSENHIRPGDIIVICPETEEQTYSLYYNAKSMWQAIDCDLSMFADVGLSNWGKLIAGLPEFAVEKLNFVKNDAKPAPSGIYAHASFDDYGDIIVDRKFNEMPTNYDLAMPISLTPELVDPEFVDYLNEYAKKAQRRGAKVFFSFSPINMESVVSSYEEAEAFYVALGESLAFPIISDLADYVLPSAYFYDTNFHLNTRGAKLRTGLIADDILRALGETTEYETVKYGPPQRPENYFQLQFDNDENAKYFEFAEIEGGLAIVGLTDEGKKQVRLTIPRGEDNKGVLTISDNAFAESKVLREIIIGEYSVLRSMTAGALSGCPSLKRIEVHLKPTALTIDSTALASMPKDCRIYIPKNAYGEFATDYFWSSCMKYVETFEVQE